MTKVKGLAIAITLAGAVLVCGSPSNAGQVYKQEGVRATDNISARHRGRFFRSYASFRGRAARAGEWTAINGANGR